MDKFLQRISSLPPDQSELQWDECAREWWNQVPTAISSEMQQNRNIGVFRALPSNDETVGKVKLFVLALLRLGVVEVNFCANDFGITPLNALLRDCYGSLLRVECVREVVSHLLEAGADPNKMTIDHWSPLLLLVRFGVCGCGDGAILEVVEDMCSMLIEHGADINAAMSNGLTVIIALTNAFSRDETVETAHRLVHVLIQKGADLEASSKLGVTAAHWLCKSGFKTPKTASYSVGLLRTFFERRAISKSSTDDGDTALICLFAGAVMSQEIAPFVLQAAEILIQADIDVKATNNRGLTALFTLILEGSKSSTGPCDGMEEIVRLLLEKGADPKVVPGGYQWTPLLCAIRMGFNRIEMAPMALRISEMLLDHGADTRDVGPDGFTALHLIARNGFIYNRAIADLASEWIDVLLDWDANPDAQTAQGYTPLSLVARFGFLHADTAEPAAKAFDDLRRMTVNVDIQGNSGWRPLNILLRYAFDLPETSQVACKLVDDLLAHDANVFAPAGNGMSPLAIITRFWGAGELDPRVLDDRLYLVDTFLTFGAIARDVPQRDGIHQDVLDRLENWPIVVTLRTLCIRVVYGIQGHGRQDITQKIEWNGVVPERLMWYPNEIEEKEEAERQQAEADLYRKKRAEEQERLKKLNKEKERNERIEKWERARQKKEGDLIYHGFLSQERERKRKREKEEDQEEERRFVRQR